MSTFRIFGIRHHGPGSSRRLISALDHYQPDCILVEFPADAEATLRQGAALALEPPVAVVLFNEKNLQQAAYYPFAEFSPEWRALRWANEHDVEVRAMDLPAANMLALRHSSQLELSDTDDDKDYLQDPLGTVARLAGYSDVEQWWEITFEQATDDAALFSAIIELMTALRAESGSDPQILLREAYMRKCMRQAVKDGCQQIAVVCGAWHAPPLHAYLTHKASTDNKLLRGLAKTKVKAAWIPWSYPRLAKNSGYGAGVGSPAWYEMRFRYGQEATVHWMVKVAQLLRKEGLDTSPAHAQEGVRLAHSLALLQEHTVPSLTALEDAALSTLCQGSNERMNLVRDTLVLGSKVGQVPENASVVPLQKNLTQLLKTSRLSKYWGSIGEQWVKATKTRPQGGIDLREPTDLLKSELLHQLQILGIPWGTLGEAGVNDQGAFKERWLLAWQPEFSLRIIEAAMWGNTVHAAAWRCLQSELATQSLLALAQRVLLGLRAGLQQAVPPVIQQLQAQAAITSDVTALLAVLPALIRIVQYGDARKTDVTALAMLIEELTPRLAIGLLGAATQIDEEQARDLFQATLAVHLGLSQMELPLLDDHWWPALHKLADYPGVHPLLQGLAVRLLFDRQQRDIEAVTERLSYALSRGNPPQDVANWLSGFLHGSGLILLYHQSLWRLVDDWVQQLDMEEMDTVLPLLRRTFAAFPAGEREQILRLVKKTTLGEGQEAPDVAVEMDNSFDPERAERVLDGLASWLVIDSGHEYTTTMKQIQD